MHNRPSASVTLPGLFHPRTTHCFPVSFFPNSWMSHFQQLGSVQSYELIKLFYSVLEPEGVLISPEWKIGLLWLDILHTCQNFRENQDVKHIYSREAKDTLNNNDAEFYSTVTGALKMSFAAKIILMKEHSSYVICGSYHHMERAGRLLHA